MGYKQNDDFIKTQDNQYQQSELRNREQQVAAKPRYEAKDNPGKDEI